jgi:hypothetical protein
VSDKTRIELDPTDLETGEGGAVQGDKHVLLGADEVDAEIRAKCTGQSVQLVAEQAEAAFATIGVQLTGEQLAGYAEAVSTGSPFALQLSDA